MFDTHLLHLTTVYVQIINNIFRYDCYHIVNAIYRQNESCLIPSKSHASISSSSTAEQGLMHKSAPIEKTD